jgi:hypothetical protein
LSTSIEAAALGARISSSCHVIAPNKRGSLLPDEARTQIEKVINPEEEDHAISKHYPVGKYGSKVREISATLATLVQAAKVAKLAKGTWNKLHTFHSKARKRETLILTG